MSHGLWAKGFALSPIGLSLMLVSFHAPGPFTLCP